MLSISKISNSKAATSYYEKDDYYAKDDPKHQQQSSWQGGGSEKLGLKGEVLKEDFKKILDGNLHNGQNLGKMKDGQMVHDAGRDLTFSAPKSVSIMALVYKDERLMQAHSNAVARTLNVVEKEFLKTRVATDKQIIIQPAENMVAATFRHFTSREQDPQLHTHAVIANIAVGKDGHAKCAFFDEIYNNKKLIGAIYRSELAKSAKELGYEIEAKGKDALFELKNVPKELMDEFSTRSKQIREKAGENASQKKLEQTTLKTRIRKKESDNLQEIWQEKIKSSPNFEKIQKLEVPKNSNQEKQDHLSQIREEAQSAKEAVLHAIDHLSERRTVFSSNEIAYEALNDKLSNITIRDVNRAINHLSEKQDHLLHARRSDLISHYTTKKALY
ncbi:MAG: conjugative relaxase, partial [Proteobacteria bacterium]|nr:conjugative relaxase [Pseudomonadota bacterium]